jgi:deferrochelatase/peroxidase EfeB
MIAPQDVTQVPAPVDLADVQGLVKYGYSHHTEAAFALLRVRDGAAARAWLAAADVATAAPGHPPDALLQVAMSAAGLRALGVAEEVMSGFAPEFVAGLGPDANRARRLGDLGANDPAQWRWGGASADRMPHVLALLYARPGRLADFTRATEAAWAGAFDVMQWLPTSDMGGVEPFGFTDGISQPEIDWSRTRVARDEDRLAYGNLSCLGEFLLGYPNEYGLYTPRPLLDPGAPAVTSLPHAEDAPGRADLGRNGSYLVLRTLAQDVAGLWRRLHAEARGDPADRTRLAEAMVGRTLDGRPLVDSSRRAVEGVGDHAEARLANGFTFDEDPQGLRCPVGAHIRRANPRNADFPPATRGWLPKAVRTFGLDTQALVPDTIASVRFHRVLRRGREYGERITLAEALSAAPPARETGLHFICLCADLARQFEFVQGAWVAGTKFAGLANEADPLLGNRVAVPGESGAALFSIPRGGAATRVITGLPQFVTVVGGAYFFLPGVRALRWLAVH